MTETFALRLVPALLLAILLCACSVPTGIPPTEASPTEASPTEASPTEAHTHVTDTPRSSSDTDAVDPTGFFNGQVRPAAVAGSWYPGDPDQLRSTVDGLLASVEPVDGAPIGLIVPHAGYTYSGPVAAAGFRQLEQGDYRVAVIIASDHQRPVSDPISVWAEGGFETPLGIVPVDEELAQALVDADPRITLDAAAHQGEHPIEIELPFLQQVCRACRIVPVLMGDDSDEVVAALSDALLEALPPEGAVVIASSDLSHYPSYEDALAVDGAILAALETGDPMQVEAAFAEVMQRGVPNLVTCACGQGPILVTLQVAKSLGADTVSVLTYANSGDAPQGDRTRVVGYGAVMLWRYELPDLTSVQKAELLGVARSTLKTYLEDGRMLGVDGDDPALSRRGAAFVTLKQDGELRGCIGRTRADLPLLHVVPHLAVQAATEDPRFPPLEPESLDDVSIEISLLSPLQRISDVSHIEVGTHGLMICKDGRQGLLLPQVPVEQGWERDEYLTNLCLKAGLPDGCWHQGAAVYAFTAVVFGEE